MIAIDSALIKANAKINLTLDIVGRRADGYHEIASVMQSVNLSDTVKVKRADGISVLCSDQSLCGGNNIAGRAAELFFEYTGLTGGAMIEIEKRIPVAAGLAGGSADAAAVITALDSVYETRLTKAVLCKIGLCAGADVPFCITGGTRLITGIGERQCKAPALPDCRIVIIKRGQKRSTGGAYAEYDMNAKNGGQKYTPDMMRALEGGDIRVIAAALGNAFEIIAPDCADIKSGLLKKGALGAALSGSGPSVYGIFKDDGAAQKCAGEYVGAYLCRPAVCGCELL